MVRSLSPTGTKPTIRMITNKCRTLKFVYEFKPVLTLSVKEKGSYIRVKTTGHGGGEV